MFQLPICPPSSPVLCPHEPYTDLVADIGCQNDEPTLTCTPLTDTTQTTGPDASGNCTGNFSNGSAVNVAVCTAAGGNFSNVGCSYTCTYPATQTCPPPE